MTEHTDIGASPEGAQSKARKPRRASSAPPSKPEPWHFTRRIRPNAFGWRTPPAVSAVKAAVTEIKRVAKSDPVRAGEGAVMFLERVAAAVATVDSSSGGMGSAVNQAVAALADVIANAPVDIPARAAWLDRLWVACEQDRQPVLERLADEWGRMCAGTELALRWGERCAPLIRSVFDAKGHVAYPPAIAIGLSSLVAAGRYTEVVDLVALHRIEFWPDLRYAVLALAALGRIDEALAKAAKAEGRDFDAGASVAEISEKVLLDAGRVDEAYARFGIRSAFAHTESRKLVVKRLVARYPKLDRMELLKGLVKCDPAGEQLWIKELGLDSRPGA